ncbi:sigma-70 family RNA polymerase sigma factor [Bacteroides gallinaceum]|uniref:Sigma-70 family RNA polymerase sigma factor n=1 Tax=Candidatus Phocaeicola excrementipullorum TaxID=2838731 RepID=A0A948X4I7_9BACT|nr:MULTISPECIES: sigma-70 family RNA polymerase sigma factor [Bacteroides]MBU3857161.1 sigma-70 family RNA polymerase sigma factor [Candidatus Phocaeicola excrementipullorum]MCR8916851.1 sigma-70 family RNA polymerase sigma factor [Bacteroides sp. ET225]MDM8208230.1 sigma-70 family RNA polymerase sigma factor [Bacteroides gallinaceum]
MINYKEWNNWTDESLWELLLNRNVEILEILYRRYYDLLLNYGLKIYPDKELVKDCIQDLFVKLHLSRKLSNTICVKTYLLKALRNLLTDKLSSIKETEDVEKVCFNLTIDNFALSALFKQNDEELKLSRQLLNAYHQLPANQREAIYLRYVKGLPYKEMAEVLDIAPQSSINLVSRALTKLRAIMQLEKIILVFLIVR